MITTTALYLAISVMVQLVAGPPIIYVQVDNYFFFWNQYRDFLSLPPVICGVIIHYVIGGLFSTACYLA
jgi:ABC-type sugar transport system permease subunit